MSLNQKILIVDDDLRNQRIVSETLEGVADFKTASNGAEALALLETDNPDLVLLDIMIPGMDGYEVCKKIRANPKMTFTKVILVSGKAMIDERLKGYSVGADDYITKPFVSEELLAKVKVFLKLTRMERDLDQFNRSLDQMVRERTSQLVAAEEKLITTAKFTALGEMAGGIAHEINSPLATIGLLVEQASELINEKPVDRKTILDMLKTVSETVKRISTIIHGLRVFSRDGSQDALEAVSLKDVIENTLTLCNEKLKHNQVQVHIEPIGDDLKIKCRSVQISQVLMNLISNSCDAVSPLPKKWIRISAEKNGDFTQIAVTDSGQGVPEPLRNKIFQPFFTTKEIGKGTGLGLSISKGIVEAHAGQLSLDVDCPNTRFILHLPTVKAKTTAKLKTKKAA